MTTVSHQGTNQSHRRGRPLFILAIAALILVGVALVWQLAGLNAAAGTPDAGPQANTPREIWAAQNIDSYRFDLEIGCFCIFEMTRPVTIEVVDGEVSSITYIDDGTAADPQFFEGFATIDQLFEQLAEKEAENPVKFDVAYDETLGIPLSAEIDVSELMADEELWLTISNFEALP